MIISYFPSQLFQRRELRTWLYILLFLSYQFLLPFSVYTYLYCTFFSGISECYIGLLLLLLSFIFAIVKCVLCCLVYSYWMP